MLITRLARRARAEGLRPVGHDLRHALGEVAYDLRRGMWTLPPVELEDLTVEGDRRHLEGYEPTRARQFRLALSRFDLPPDGRFVDLGCGKGRAMVLALEHGFDAVLGIELAAELASHAERTVARRTRRRGGRAEVRHGDAGSYAFAPEDRVVFLYNPFGRVVLSRVLDNLRTSLAEHPRDVRVVYANPLQRELLDRDDLWQLTGWVRFHGGVAPDYLCYQSRVSAA